MDNSFSFAVYGRMALFSDPITRVGGEKISYPIPTYEAIKGIVKSIYWKPTLIWYVDKVRVMKPLKTERRSIKTIKYSNGKACDLSIYTYLMDVMYQIKAHYEWNMHQPRLEPDRNYKKHTSMFLRALEHGGRQDIFLGTRECQGYVEPCNFGEGEGAYDDLKDQAYGLTFHGFDYPEETGNQEFSARFWFPVMKHGIIDYPLPTSQDIIRKHIRRMTGRQFGSCTEQFLQPKPSYPNAKAIWLGLGV